MEERVTYDCAEHGHILNAAGVCIFCGHDTFAEHDDEELGGRFSDDIME